MVGFMEMHLQEKLGDTAIKVYHQGVLKVTRERRAQIYLHHFLLPGTKKDGIQTKFSPDIGLPKLPSLK